MQRGLLILFGLLSTLLLVFDQIDQRIDVFGSSISLDLGFVDALERKAYDLRVNLSAREVTHNTVVIIDIDEKSLLAEGQFPWRRAKVADLVDKLFDNYGIETLGFDVVFAEPENSFSRDQIQRALTDPSLTLEDMEAESGDAKLAKALENRSIVMGIVFEPESGASDMPESIGKLPPPMFTDDDEENEYLLKETGARVAGRYTANLPVFQQAAGEAGFFSILLQDPDGIIRRVGLFNKFEGRLYASLSLKLVQAYFVDDPQPVFADQKYTTDDYNSFEAIEFLMLENPLPLDENAGVFVPYANPNEGFEYVSATEILQGTYQGDINGAIAILGTSAAGLVDRRSTPVSPVLSGVEVHANVVAGILDGEFRVQPAWAIAANVIGVLILGVVLSVLFPYLSAFWSAFVFTLSSAAAIWLNWYMWSNNLILAIAPALFLISFLYVMTTVVGFFMESSQRRVTQKMFGLYVPPEVVAEMHGTEDIFSQKPERKLMTVLFTDIRNFTTHSESMNPEDLAEWLNDFLTPMTTIIHKHKGAIDKYMGDAIMAFWGAPLDDDDHAEHAIDAAKEMVEYLDTLNAHYRRKGWPEIQIGIGLNTGDMSVGNMGSEFRMAYTVVGDAVNLGSRLEGLTKQYGVPIIVSEFTVNAVSNYEFERLDHVKVKGKTEGVTIFSIGNKAASA